MQVPFKSLSQVTKGHTAQLLSDASALYTACRRIACLSEKDCEVLAGETVRVLATDDSDDTVKVNARLKGEIWLTIESFTSGDAPGAPEEEGKEEVPLEHLSQVFPGKRLKLLSDPVALRQACRRVACLSEQDCAKLAGTIVQATALDPSDSTVSVDTDFKGEIWFTVQCFVEAPDLPAQALETEPLEALAAVEPEVVESDAAAAGTPADADDAPAEDPEDAGARGIFQQFAAAGSLLDAVGAAAEEAASEARYIVDEATRREEEELAAAFAARAAAAEERRKLQQSKGAAGAGAAMLAAAAEGAPVPEGPCTNFPLGRRVRVLQNIVMKREEDILSTEILKLTEGQELRVLEHGFARGGRRLKAKEMDTGIKGWVSCATKTDKPLLELLSGVALPLHELDPPTSSALVKMPSVEEVLMRVDADIYCGEEAPKDDGSRAPKAILDAAEEEAEAICVWRAFDDMAAVDEPEQEDPRESDPRCLNARAREREMFEGELVPIVGMMEEQNRLWQDRQLKQLSKDRNAKVSRGQQMKEKIREALNPRSKGLMPKMRGICSRNMAVGTSEASSSSSSAGVAGPIAAPLPAGAASRVTHFSTAMGLQATRLAPRPSSWPEAPSSQFSQQQQASLQSIEELRCTLEEERRQVDEEEPASGSQLALQPQTWVPRRVRQTRAQGWAAGAEAEAPMRAAVAAMPQEPEVVDMPAAPEPEISEGMVVQVHGLKSAPDLNGLHGVVERWDSEGNRWIVRFFQSDKMKKFRPQNLAPCAESPWQDPPPPSGMDEFGPAWFGQPDSGGAADYGRGWTGRQDPSEPVPDFNSLLQKLDGPDPALEAARAEKRGQAQATLAKLLSGYKAGRA